MFCGKVSQMNLCKYFFYSDTQEYVNIDIHIATSLVNLVNIVAFKLKYCSCL